MGTALTDSLIRPKEIVNHITSTKKTIAYFIFLVVLFTLPNLVYVISSGGVGKADVNYLVDMISAEESIPYQIVNNELVFNGEDEKKPILITTKSSQVSIMFTDATRTDLKGAFGEAIKDKSRLVSPLIIIFTKDGISLGIGKSQSTFNHLKKLINYSELKIEKVNFDELEKLDVQNTLGSIFLNLIDKYQVELILIILPMILISGMITLFILILIPSLICFIFNRSLNIKFGTILKLAIYSFTPFVIATLISLGNSSSLLAMIVEFISLIYLFISISSYYIQKNGGQHEL